ncbi:MAG TPA: hypothetical protein VIM40_12875, partial [Arthrobacter sp.]
MSNPQEPYRPAPPSAWPQEPVGQPGIPPQSGAPSQFGAPGQYSSEAPFGLPGEPPARNRRKLWTILGVVAGVLLLVIIGVVILVNVVNGATNHARGLAEAFTKLVIAGDSSTAYDDYLD